jgi:hypothetical protein
VRISFKKLGVIINEVLFGASQRGLFLLVLRFWILSFWLLIFGSFYETERGVGVIWLPFLLER